MQNLTQGVAHLLVATSQYWPSLHPASHDLRINVGFPSSQPSAFKCSHAGAHASLSGTGVAAGSGVISWPGGQAKKNSVDKNMIFFMSPSINNTLEPKSPQHP